MNNELVAEETTVPVVVTPLKVLIHAQLEADKRIAELEAELKPLKEAKSEIKSQILQEFKRRGEFTTRVDGATATLSVRKTAVVVDEPALMAELKARGLDQYITEALTEEFDGVKKLMATGDEPLMPGVEIRETEFISIRKNEKADPRKVTAGEFVKLDNK